MMFESREDDLVTRAEMRPGVAVGDDVGRFGAAA